jgi:hypothetical protein
LLIEKLRLMNLIVSLMRCEVEKKGEKAMRVCKYNKFHSRTFPVALVALAKFLTALGVLKWGLDPQPSFTVNSRLGNHEGKEKGQPCQGVTLP